MANLDNRLVQTAVIGSRESGRAIVLTTDADELDRWRRRHPNYTYWCGTQLGGCGHELSDRLYRDKVCHFAHRPNTSCHRTATGVASADHLFIKDDLATWAGQHRLKGRATSRNLGNGPGDAVDFRLGEAKQHVRFQFSTLTHSRWNETRDRLSREASTLDWVFGPGTARPETMEELYDEYGYLLRFRFQTMGAVRRIRLRAEDPRRSTDWVPLDACAMTPDGLRFPGVERRRRSPRARKAAGPRRPRYAAPVERSREEQVLALREALVSSARFRTRPTWESLCRTAGSDLLRLPEPNRIGLLIDVERSTGGEDGPLLSALLRTAEGGPPPYAGDVALALGCGIPATAAMLKRWCQREADRAFAVYGIPSRTAPPRLTLTAEGRIASQSAEQPGRRTIVHSQGGPVPQAPPRTKREAAGREGTAEQRCAEIRHALLAARLNKTPSRVAALLEQAEAVLPHLPESLHDRLRSEMTDVHRWLNGNQGKKKSKPKQTTAGAAGKSKKAKRKKAKRRKTQTGRPG